MKIKPETKKKAIAYLVKRSTLTREVSLEEMLHFQKYMIRFINKKERILGNGYSVLSHSEEYLHELAKKDGIQLPDFFSIVIHADRFWISDKWGENLHTDNCFWVSDKANCFWVSDKANHYED